MSFSISLLCLVGDSFVMGLNEEKREREGDGERGREREREDRERERLLSIF